MDERLMHYALDLAKAGIGFVNPNPYVGAVIVKNARIIAEGYHAAYGKAHAEVNALKNAKESVEGATMVVTLEPCSHIGKTPPCAKTIIEAGIKRVVIASVDPNPLVAGKGIQMLKDANISVRVGVLDEENRLLNKVFFKYIQQKMPYVLLKTAMSVDGKIATKTGDAKWITNEVSRDYVHTLRHQYTGIMVGVNTIIKDDPMLTTRLKNTDGRNPVKIIVDSKGTIPLDASVLKSEGDTIIATTHHCPQETIDALKAKGADVMVIDTKEKRVDLRLLMQALAKKGIDGILLEGGATLNAAMLEDGLVDEVMAFIAPSIIGGTNAPTPIGGKGIASMAEKTHLKHLDTKRFGDDFLLHYKVMKETD